MYSCNKLLSTVFIAISWHVCLKDIGQNEEVFFVNKKKKKKKSWPFFFKLD